MTFVFFQACKILNIPHCYGKQRPQLWTEQRGAGEDRAEVRPRPGAATGGLDNCTMWGQPGEATTWERELPEVADGWDSKWPVSLHLK